MKISELEPKAVWAHFERICAIPRPSHSEQKIRDYIVGFAASHGLECKVDEACNVIVRKPATAGMENRKGVILQAHLDMVPQKNGDKVFDFTTDAIQAYVDGDWVTADGTTLGADNGMGVAAILAVLESEKVKHGPLEALFTATEETGMDGAFGLKAGDLTGEILLNLDSETEGELYVGCAGGTDANMSLGYAGVAVPQGYAALRIEVKGLKGGHSGIEIILQRANANKLMFRLLRSLAEKFGAELGMIDGGGLRNAIPREAVAEVVLPEGMKETAKVELLDMLDVFKTEFAGIEDSITVEIKDAALPESIMPHDTFAALTAAVCACPNGVLRMSGSMPGLVQTSNNFARVVSDGGSVKMQALMRSSVGTEKMDTALTIRDLFRLAGAEVELTGSYDGWNPNMDSPILHAMMQSYKALFGVEPKVTAIHAGLECGIIGGKYPGMDMISFGPTICYPHSPDEKVDIASVGKFWEFLCDTLARIPEK